MQQLDSANSIWEKDMLTTVDNAKGAAADFGDYKVVANLFRDVSAVHVVLPRGLVLKHQNFYTLRTINVILAGSVGNIFPAVLYLENSYSFLRVS